METIKKLTNVLESPQESGSWPTSGTTGTTPGHSTPYHTNPYSWNNYPTNWNGYPTNWMTPPYNWAGYQMYYPGYQANAYNGTPYYYNSYYPGAYPNSYTPTTQNYDYGTQPYTTPNWGWNTPKTNDYQGTQPYNTPYWGNTPMTSPNYNNEYGYDQYMHTVNFYEDEKCYRIEMAVPSMTKSDCKLWTENGMLWVSGYKNKNGQTRKMNKTEKEYNNYSFSRWFMLPRTVDSNKIQAKCTNGILYLTLTKKTGKAANEIAIS